MWAHLIGIWGELLNLAGAIVLARDIFLRRKEHELDKTWNTLHNIAVLSSLKRTRYKGYSIAAPSFRESVAQRRADHVGYWGVSLLGAGFLLLAAYHGLEIWESCRHSAY